MKTTDSAKIFTVCQYQMEVTVQMRQAKNVQDFVAMETISVPRPFHSKYNILISSAPKIRLESSLLQVLKIFLSQLIRALLSITFMGLETRSYHGNNIFNIILSRLASPMH